MSRAGGPEPRWLLLIHKIPGKPAYLRVKIWRRLQQLGALGVKNALYALPSSDGALEDLEWVAREIVSMGGEASICEARFVHGLDDAQIEALFNTARDEDYAAITADLRPLRKRLSRSRRPSAKLRDAAEPEVTRARKRFEEVAAIDFFGAPGREAVREMLSALEAHLHGADGVGAAPFARPEYQGRTWVTRKSLFVDRIASAWLIRRFIDSSATFKYVAGKNYRPEPGELRFDMFEGEFTHVGDRCTFEVLIERIGLDDRALDPIAEIVHDIDIKDGKYGRAQAPGIEGLLAGIASTSQDDDERLARGARVFDDLYEFFRRKRA